MKKTLITLAALAAFATPALAAGTSTTDSEAFTAVVVIVALLFFLPTVIASSRGHASVFGVFAANLIIGLTGLGWLIALVWGLTGKTKSQNKLERLLLTNGLEALGRHNSANR
jgi:protein-S-isoprenylcysteine O-methyltransferase Ste14